MNDTSQLDAPSAASGATTQSRLTTELAVDNVKEDGAFVCNKSGHLLRVTEGKIYPSDRPTVCLVGKEPLTVTKISDNPYVGMIMARYIAANSDLDVNF